MAVEVQHASDRRIDDIMGMLLRTGVICAALVVFAGGLIYFARHREPVTNYHVFSGQPVELRHIPGIVHQAFTLHGRGMIQLGLLILIATPVARVAFSVLAFLYERDWMYVAMTLLVLTLLLYSLFGGYG
jgi:uncharacterized membrane protein